jgi:hypothetical protein
VIHHLIKPSPLLLGWERGVEFHIAR